MPSTRRDSWHWERFIEEGDELFSYMISNYNSMFSHFDIIPGVGCNKENRELMSVYGKEIEKESVSWIYDEKMNGNLFKKDYWSPFSDEYESYDMFLGYKRFFIYTEYKTRHYLQLGIDTKCRSSLLHPCDDCINSIYRGPHFIFAYYGWREEGGPLKPRNFIGISDESDWFPEKYWEILG